MTFAHSREHDFARNRDQLLDLLSTSPFVTERLQLEQAQRVARRQELVDRIADARKRIEAELPSLERAAATAYGKMTAQLAKLRECESAYIAAVTALRDLDFSTGRTIADAERELERSADPAIDAFDREAEALFHQIRTVPIGEVGEGKIDPLTGKWVAPPARKPTQQDLVESLDLIRALQKRARQMKREAIGDVHSAIDALRDELPRPGDFR